MTHDRDFDREIERLRSEGRAFAVATVVRTVSSTSARPGDKALLDTDGDILVGFLGGGCVRGAVRRAACDAIASAETQFVSLKPQDLLEADGLSGGEEVEGVRYARNGCPSGGSMDIFVEPVLPKPKLVICGQSAVALALAEMAERFEFERILCLPSAPDKPLPVVEKLITSFDAGPIWEDAPFIVVATQGSGDEAALHRALAQKANYIAFVGSRKKFATLAARLVSKGISAEALEAVEAPAGLNINAIAPDEIALSILARIIQVHRAATRTGPAADHPATST